MQVWIGFGIDSSGAGSKALVCNANGDFWRSLEILQPVGRRVFGDDVEAALIRGEPDLNFTRAARLATARGQIEILFAVETTDL